MHRPHLLQLIGVLKLTKAVALLASLAVAIHVLRRTDPVQTILAWALKLHVDPGNAYLRALLSRVLALQATQFELLAAATVVYAALFTAEGVGLLLAHAWAAYLTIVETATFIPIEVYEIARRAGLLRIMVLALNVLIVIYLVRHVRRRHLPPRPIRRRYDEGRTPPGQRSENATS